MARPLASCDTLYVAVAETLACSLLTVDAKLAQGPDRVARSKSSPAHDERGPPLMAGRSDDEKLAAMIDGLDPDDVADLLVRAALEHDDVARAVRLAAADDGDRLQVLRQAVDGSLRTRRFLDYWASSRWAADAAPVVVALRDEAERQQSKELVALLERGIGHLVKVLLTADDSNGEIGSLAHELLQLHAEVCDAGVADPAALAKWMVRFTFEDQDFFSVDPVRYRAALGEDGLTAYRREVTKRAAKVDDADPPRRPYAVDYATQRLAILDRDVDTLVALLGRDLSNAYQFERVADAMLELDDPDAALEWARRGIVETSGWQVAKLYDLAAGLLGDRADAEGVFELRLHQHERMPSSTTYRQLRGAAEQLGRWDTERAAARSVLEQRSPAGFVDALLDDGDTATAWAAADGNPEWHLDVRQWERLADARRPGHPADALAVYLQLADAALVEANKNAYRTGVKHLKAARSAAAEAGVAADFDARMAVLREQHRRRPTLMAMLDKAKLP